MPRYQKKTAPKREPVQDDREDKEEKKGEKTKEEVVATQNAEEEEDVGNVLNEEEALDALRQAKQVAQKHAELRKSNSPAAILQLRRKLKLKPDLKKSLTFVKRVKQLSDDVVSQLERDIQAVDLSHHATEVARALVHEGLKPSDIPSAVRLASMLHQRYPAFAPTLLTTLLNELKDAARIAGIGMPVPTKACTGIGYPPKDDPYGLSEYMSNQDEAATPRSEAPQKKKGKQLKSNRLLDAIEEAATAASAAMSRTHHDDTGLGEFGDLGLEVGGDFDDFDGGVSISEGIGGASLVSSRSKTKQAKKDTKNTSSAASAYSEREVAEASQRSRTLLRMLWNLFMVGIYTEEGKVKEVLLGVLGKAGRPADKELLQAARKKESAMKEAEKKKQADAKESAEAKEEDKEGEDEEEADDLDLTMEVDGETKESDESPEIPRIPNDPRVPVLERVARTAVKDLPFALAMLKEGEYDMTGVYSKSVEQYRAALPSTHSWVAPASFFPDELRDQVLAACDRYFDAVSQQLAADHVALAVAERRNKVILLRKGELGAKRAERFESDRDSYENLRRDVGILADLLNREMPAMPTEEDITRLTGTKDNAWESMLNLTVVETGPFDDEDSRSFYEDILSLREMVPPSLFEDSRKSKEKAEDQPKASSSQGSQQQGNKVDLTKRGNLDSALAQIFELGPRPAPPAPAPAPAPVAAPAPAPAPAQAAGRERTESEPGKETPAAEEGAEEKAAEASETTELTSSRREQLKQLLERLPLCINREHVDKFALAFIHLNSKAARTQLLEELLAVKSTNLHLLPHYSRLAATIHKAIPEFGESLVDVLKRDLKFWLRTRRSSHLDMKQRNARFLGELTKFRVCPGPTTLYILEKLLEDFGPHACQTLATLLESCGRFLYKTAEYQVRASAVLATLKKKMEMEHIGSLEADMLENAYYVCLPPERSIRTPKERTPMEKFVRFLLLERLCEKNEEETLRILRKLPWNTDTTIKPLVLRTLMKVVNGRYNGIHLASSILSGLQRFYESIGREAVDMLLRNIVQGLEDPASRSSQRRMSDMKLLGEFYSYRLVDSRTVFRVLYLLLNHGHALPVGEEAKEGAEEVDMNEAKHEKPGSAMWDTVSSACTPLSKEVLGRAGRLRVRRESLFLNKSGGFLAYVVKVPAPKAKAAESSGPSVNAEEPEPRYALIRRDPCVGSVGYHPLVPCPVDTSRDVRRLRMACVLLQTCAEYFKKGMKQRLSRYLVHLQRYALTKSPMPVDAEFHLSETLEVIGSSSRLLSFAEAQTAAEVEEEKEIRERLTFHAAHGGKHVDKEEARKHLEMTFKGGDEESDEDMMEGEDDELDDEEEEDEGKEDLLDDELSVEEEKDDADEHLADLSDSDDEAVVLDMEENVITEDDLEFERLFESTMQETNMQASSYKGASQLSNMVIPTQLQVTLNQQPERSEDGMQFKVLSRNRKTKGGKAIEVKDIMLPDELAIVQKSQKQLEERQKEQELIKRRVLEYHASMQDDEYDNDPITWRQHKALQQQQEEGAAAMEAHGRGKGKRGKKVVFGGHGAGELQEAGNDRSWLMKPGAGARVEAMEAVGMDVPEFARRRGGGGGHDRGPPSGPRRGGPRRRG